MTTSTFTSVGGGPTTLAGIHRRMNLTRARQSVVVRVLAQITLIIVLFLLFNVTYRAWEVQFSVWVLDLFSDNRIFYQGDTSALVRPIKGDPAFAGVVAPSCSAASSLLVIATLAALLPPYLKRRRSAVVIAMVVIAAGNLLRIIGSLGFGIYGGKIALISFHDYVGSVFTFVYTLLGFILMLYIMLPKRAPVDDIVPVAEPLPATVTP